MLLGIFLVCDVKLSVEPRVTIRRGSATAFKQKKFENKMDRVINGITNKSAHETNGL
jgi:hypothetical protein